MDKSRGLILLSSPYTAIVISILLAIVQVLVKARAAPTERRAEGNSRFQVRVRTAPDRPHYRGPLALHQVKTLLTTFPDVEIMDIQCLLPEWRWLEQIDIGPELCSAALGADISALTRLMVLILTDQVTNISWLTIAVIPALILVHIGVLHAITVIPEWLHMSGKDDQAILVPALFGFMGLVTAFIVLGDLLTV